MRRSTVDSPRFANFTREYPVDERLPNGAESCLRRAVERWTEGDWRGATGALNMVYLKLEIDAVYEEAA